MTQVYLELDGDRCTLSCRGHASSPALCAAISCLAYTAAGWALNRAEVLTRRLEDADACVSFAGPESRTVFELLRIGFLQLAKAQPDGVRVHVKKSGCAG